MNPSPSFLLKNAESVTAKISNAVKFGFTYLGLFSCYLNRSQFNTVFPTVSFKISLDDALFSLELWRFFRFDDLIMGFGYKFWSCFDSAWALLSMEMLTPCFEVSITAEEVFDLKFLPYFYSQVHWFEDESPNP